MPLRTGSTSSMISIARTLGAPDSVPAGSRPQGIDRLQPVLQRALDVAADVLEMAVLLDGELLDDPHRTDLGDAADIVARQVEQHQVLGMLLGIGQERFSASRLSSSGVAPRRMVPASGRMVTCCRAGGPGSRARADDGEVAVVEEDQEWRRVDAAQRAVERQRRQQRNSAKRCDGTIWKASPARMYSF